MSEVQWYRDSAGKTWGKCPAVTSEFIGVALPIATDQLAPVDVNLVRVGTGAVKQVQACASSTAGATNNSELDKLEKLLNRKWNPLRNTLINQNQTAKMGLWLRPHTYALFNLLYPTVD